MRNLFLKVFIFLIVLYLLLSFFYQKQLPSLKESLFWLQAREAGVEKFYHDLTKAYKIVKVNGNIQLAAAELSAQENALKQLTSSLWYENRRFQEAAGFVAKSELNLVPAQIISRSPDNWFSFVIINKGFKEHIKIHDPVIVAEGVVGEIVEIFAHQSRVSLLTDRSLRISCEDVNTNEVGITEGRVVDLLAFNYLPANSQVQPGDKLKTSGYSQKYPKGLTVGEVVSVKQRQGDIFKLVMVKPAVNLSKLNIVFVLKD
jgi:rod shape-determining protein MreC